METDNNNNRSGRAALASETLAALAVGYYTLRDGRRIEIAATLQQCVAGTKLVLPESLSLLVDAADATPRGFASTRIEVVNEPTLNGIRRLRQDSAASIAALNFASAKNPGGGFLGGSQAQEESLARSSGLYASLSAIPDYYEYHRAQGSALYSDRVVWTPDCPIFRDDAGALLDEPHSAAFLTCAAPNAGAVHQNAPEDTPLIAPTLRRRAECVLAVAAAEHCDQHEQAREDADQADDGVQNREGMHRHSDDHDFAPFFVIDCRGG